jgi:hypothetical protein
MIKETTSMEACLSELMIIFQNNFCKSEEFKRELFKELSKATGNNNLSLVCREFIDF